jgi:GntR family transcriptional regulator
MLFELNFKSGIPVYLQLVEQIKAAAASGTLRTGEPLPSIRPLAEQLRVNRNTVAKAYAELENQRIIETQAGKGSFLLEGASPLRKDVRKQMVGEAIDEAIIKAHHLQVNGEDFLKLTAERLAAYEQRLKANGHNGGK